MTALAKTYYTAQQYLEIERQALEKSEYFKGETFAMAGASTNHNRITRNVSGLVWSFLRKKKSCESFSNDMRVHIPENTLFTYPDIVIACGKLEFLDDESDTLINPNVIVEVLSASTQNYDRGNKFGLYRSIPTLQEYVLIDSKRIKIELFRKSEAGTWVLEYDTQQTDETIDIKTIGLSLTMADIYDQTTGIFGT